VQDRDDRGERKQPWARLRHHPVHLLHGHTAVHARLLLEGVEHLYGEHPAHEGSDGKLELERELGERRARRLIEREHALAWAPELVDEHHRRVAAAGA